MAGTTTEGSAGSRSDRARGLILLITIAATFWGGVAIGGVHDTVYPTKRKPWFLAQVFTGSHALAAYAWGSSVRPGKEGDLVPPRNPSFASIDTAVVYTGIAGLLNLLVILDAIGRADRPSAIAESRRRKAASVASGGQERLA